ncbi:MAG: ankyrin repeat domain-containing protein [Alphaproteobacteria bacterium]
MTQVPAVTFWIQGRADDRWQNLVHFADFEGAATSMRRLSRSGEYTQLRLVEASLSADGKTPVYRERLRSTDGRIVAPPRRAAGPAASAAAPAPVSASVAPSQTAPAEDAEADWLSIDLATAARANRLTEPEPDTAPLDVRITRLTDAAPGPTKTQVEMQALLQAVAATKPSPVVSPAEADEEPEPAAAAPETTKADTAEEPEFIRALRRVSQPPQAEENEDERQDDPDHDPIMRRAAELAARPRLGTGIQRSAVPPSALLPEPPDIPPPHMLAPEPPRRSRRGLALVALLAVAILAGVVLAALDPRGTAQLVASLMNAVQGPPEEPPLIAAILEDPSGQRVQSLLSGGTDPNQESLSGTPALLVAARSHAIDSLDRLLAAGADPTAPIDASGIAVVHATAREGLTAALGQILAAGADIDMRSGMDGCETPLSAAVAAGQLRTVQMLLERGAMLERPEGCSGELLALAKPHPAILARLEEAFAAKIAEGKRQEKPVQSAAPAPGLDPATALAELSADPAKFPSLLFSAIDGGQGDLVRALLVDRPEHIRLDDVVTFVSDKWGTGYRSAVDYALLRGERAIAATLMGSGLIPSTELFHLSIERSTEPALAGVANFLIENGADLNAMHDGMTALMRAAHAGNLALVKEMLQQGANPLLQTPNGLTAADFAPASADPALRELLAMQTKGSKYAKLMFGLSWLDRLDNVKGKVRDCRSLGDRFTACDVRFDPWLPDVEAVEAHFDRSADGRLVAIEVRSKPIRDRTRNLDGSGPRERFEQVRTAIEERLPKEHVGFATRQVPAGVPFWQGLKPDVKAGEYYAYWSDEEGSRPAFIYLKLTGRGENDGFYQIVIGNPYRIS